MKNPQVSVVMPAYNHEKFVGDAINSVLNQTYENFELIIINDGSTDATERVIKGFEDDRINYHLQENQGAHNAINKGIGLAKGKYVSIINSDDLYGSERLSFLTKIAEEKEAQFIFTGLNFVGDNVEYKNMLSEWYEKLNSIYTQSKSIEKTLLTGNVAITSSNFFFNRELTKDIGDFSSYRYVHDYDFILSALIKYPERCFYFAENNLLSYRVHGSNTISESSLKATIETIDLLGKRTPEFAGFEDFPELAATALEYIQELNEHLTHVFEELNDVLKNRDRIIKEKDELIIRTRDKIEHNEVIIKHKEKLLGDITSSISWKITAPIRWLGALISKKR